MRRLAAERLAGRRERRYRFGKSFSDLRPNEWPAALNGKATKWEELMTLIKILKKSALGLAAFGFLAAASPTYAADLVMWERSGGNKDMVDRLVEMWNAKFPDRHINLTYIPHAEMVAKLAQAIASGDVP